MAIQIFCPGCKTSYGLEAKSCSKCGATFGRDKKYRVCVSDKGKRITKGSGQPDPCQGMGNGHKGRSCQR